MTNYLKSKVFCFSLQFLKKNCQKIELLYIESEIEKILKLEMTELYKVLVSNPELIFEIELKEDLFQKCGEAEFVNQVSFLCKFIGVIKKNR